MFKHDQDFVIHFRDKIPAAFFSSAPCITMGAQWLVSCSDKTGKLEFYPTHFLRIFVVGDDANGALYGHAQTRARPCESVDKIVAQGACGYLTTVLGRVRFLAAVITNAQSSVLPWSRVGSSPCRLSDRARRSRWQVAGSGWNRNSYRQITQYRRIRLIACRWTGAGHTTAAVGHRASTLTPALAMAQ